MGVITGVMCCLSHRRHLLEVLWGSCVGCVADVVLPMLQVSCVYMSYASRSVGMCWLYYRCHVLAVLHTTAHKTTLVAFFWMIVWHLVTSSVSELSATGVKSPVTWNFQTFSVHTFMPAVEPSQTGMMSPISLLV